MAGNVTNKKEGEWERIDIDYDQFPLSLYVYNRQGKKLLVSQKKKKRLTVESRAQVFISSIGVTHLFESSVDW